MSLPIVLMPSHDSTTRHPRIGYLNLGADSDATVTSDSTAAGYLYSNPFDWKPYTYWKPAAGGSHYIRIVTAGAKAADYFAIAQHNIGTNGGTITLQYSLDSGATWLDAVPAFSPVGTEQLWWDFDEVSTDYWRIVVASTVASVLGIAAFGLKYQPYRGQYSGFQPPKMARVAKQYTSTSEGGLFLGRSILRKEIQGSIAFDLMLLNDAYGDWLPFMKAAEQHAFFLAWMLEDWPDDVQLVMTDGDMTPPAMTEFGFVGVTLAYRGLLQE